MSTELWIPRLAPNLNDLIRAKGGKGYAYNKLKKSWAQTVAFCVAGGRIMWGKPPTLSPCAVHIQLVEPNRKRDPDNIAAGAAKLILDGLVQAGVLEGDGWDQVTALSFSWRVGKHPGVRVVLTPAVTTNG